MIGVVGILVSYEDKLLVIEWCELFVLILGEGQWLDCYIQNLFDMICLGYGMLKFNCDWIDSVEIVGVVLGWLCKLFFDLCVEIDVLCDVVLMYVYLVLIEQVLFNILENVVCFLLLNELVCIIVYVVDDCLLIDVVDCGLGIFEDECVCIFDMFYLVVCGDCVLQGIGLGLVICCGMIGVYGGSVEVLLGDGVGMVIWISLLMLELFKSDD